MKVLYIRPESVNGVPIKGADNACTTRLLGVRVQEGLHVGGRGHHREVGLHGLTEATHVLLGRDDGGLLSERAMSEE